MPRLRSSHAIIRALIACFPYRSSRPAFFRSAFFPRGSRQSKTFTLSPLNTALNSRGMPGVRTVSLTFGSFGSFGSLSPPILSLFAIPFSV